MNEHELSIAVVAMEGRFPGADSVEELWNCLVAEKDLVTAIDPQDFLAAGADPALLNHPDLVLHRAAIRDIASFDHQYFGLTKSEAELIDPQHRIFCQVVVHALEQAGIDPARTEDVIGVYASSGQGHYERKILSPHQPGPESLETFTVAISNLVSSMPTRVAYSLGLRGPALSVQTACSSSLVAVHLACQDLLTFRCDVALAGGATINPTSVFGALTLPDGLLSPDGRCRPFSASANGIGGGDAAAVVVLKRYADAVADGDPIRAVIRATAINNDGRDKVGFTAPSVSGQARVIRDALELAMLEPSDIGYVEAHGTGTATGDTIEIAALRQAFGVLPQGSCGIGSVKSNIGHTDTAAGVSALIKAVLCVERGIIPASLHFDRPNPEIDLASSPFRVVAATETWEPQKLRRVGVSSFGIGGTNAHAIVEQSTVPPKALEKVGSACPVLMLTAATEGALARRCADLEQWLADHPEADLEAVAATLRARVQHGRLRRSVPAASRESARCRLKTLPDRPGDWGSDLWLFPGGGTLSPGCVGDLTSWPAFAVALDEAGGWVAKEGADLSQVLARGPRDNFESSLATLSVQYALIRLLSDLLPGPRVVIGHSLGEYAAAIAAGVLTLPDALRLAAARGKALDAAGGSTVLVGAAHSAVAETLTSGLRIAADNGPSSCLVSGTTRDVSAWATAAEAGHGWLIREVDVHTAVHHPLLDPHLDGLREALCQVELRTPSGPMFISTVTGRPITEELTTVQYWVDQLRQTVLLADALAALPKQMRGGIEVGPGQSLTSLGPSLGLDVLPTMARRSENATAGAVFSETLGRLWEVGVPVSWPDQRAFLPLPCYPFEKVRCWPSSTPARTMMVIDGLGEGYPTAQRYARQSRPLLLSAEIVPANATLAAAEEAVTEIFDRQLHTVDQELDEIAASECRRCLLERVPELVTGLSPAQLRARLGIRGPYQRLVDALISMLEHQQLLRRESGLLIVSPPPGDEPTYRNPELRAEIDLIRHCAERFVDIVAGVDNAPAALLSGVLTQDETEDHRAEQTLGALRDRLVKMVCDLARQAAPEPLRILEIGAGRGMLSWPTVEALQNHPNARFLFTDIGRSFVLDAQRRCRESGLRGVEYAVFDVGRSGTEQGLEAGSQDVVLAYNSLHAAPDAAVAVRHAAELLAPGGTMLIVELHALPGHGVLTAGLHEGMWHFTDDRPDGLPLLPPDKWKELLYSAGCADVRCLMRNNHHTLLVARRAPTLPAERLTELRRQTRVKLASLAELAGTVWESSIGRGLVGTPQTELPVSPPVDVDSNGLGEDRLNRRGHLSVPYRAPRTALENRLASLWADTLGLDEVGIDDDFFELGGESLLAIRTMGRLREETGVNLPVRTLFDHFTVAALAKYIEENQDATAVTPPSTSQSIGRRIGRRVGFRSQDGTIQVMASTQPEQHQPGEEQHQHE